MEIATRLRERRVTCVCRPRVSDGRERITKRKTHRQRTLIDELGLIHDLTQAKELWRVQNQRER